jgi:hypothetical protein
MSRWPPVPPRAIGTLPGLDAATLLYTLRQAGWPGRNAIHDGQPSARSGWSIALLALVFEIILRA